MKKLILLCVATLMTTLMWTPGHAQSYCTPEGTNANRYIENFSTTSGSQNITNNASGFSAGGYGDFTSLTVEQGFGGSINFEANVMGGTAGFRIWVDWNQDGEIDTVNEVAYQSSSYSATHSGSFTVPADALVGSTRMRVVSHYFSSSGDVDPCATGFPNGEFEDYTFNVTSEASFDCPNLEANIGDSCDDGDPNTANDTVDENCGCEGIPVATNDEACTATAIACGDTIEQTLIGATSSMDDDCFGSGSADVWFSFTTDGSQLVTVAENSSFDGVVQLFVGDDCGAIEEAGACRDFGENFTVTEAGTYYFRVRPYSDSNDEGTISVNLSCEDFDCSDLQANIGDSCDDGNPNTINDVVTEDCDCAGELPAEGSECTTAIPVECNADPVTYSSENSNGTNTTECSLGDNGLWFSFVGTGGDITITSTADFDHEMSINSGSCDDLTNIGCDDQSTLAETYTIEASVEDEMYYVYIADFSSFGNGNTGDITIDIDCAPPAECTAPSLELAVQDADGNAIEDCLDAGSEYFVLATLSGGDGNDSYNVTANDNDAVEVDADGSEVLGPFTVGTDVDVTAVGAQDDACDVSGSIDSPAPCPPDNDSCDDALALECGVDPITVSSTGSTAESPDGCSIGDNGVWFSFVGTGGDITINSSANFDHKMSMQSGSCDDLAFIACKDGSVGDETYIIESSVEDEMYYVYVAHYSSYTSSTGDITISIECAEVPGPPAIDLNSAGDFGVLAGSGITSAGASIISNTNVGVSPSGRETITGDIVVVNGAIYAADDATPPGVPAMLLQAKSDLQDAYNFAAGASAPAPATVADDLGGQTLFPGIYKSTSTLQIQNGDLTLDAQGDPDARWIFQIASSLTTVSGGAGNVILTGGAQAKNITWQVGSSATIATSFKGNILAHTSITMGVGSTIDGRLLAIDGLVALSGSIIIDQPCPAPLDLVASNITTQSADISWEEGSNETEWEVSYGPANFDPNGSQGTTVSVSIDPETTLMNLTIDTDYDVYVRAICDVTNEIEWAGPVSFTTGACSFTTVPYTMDFETATVPELPNCTSSENTGIGTDWKTKTAPSGFTGKVLNYSYHLATGPANSWFYTQGLELEVGVDYEISYKYGNNTTYYTESMKVAYGTSPDEAAMTNQLANYPTIELSSPAEESITFTVAADGVYYFGFNAYSIENQNQLYVDDINIIVAPTCPAPADLAVDNITDNSAELTWTSTANQSDIYLVEEGESAPDESSTPTDSGVLSPITLDNLTDNTAYEVYVRADCAGQDGVSTWAGPISFTTLVTPPDNDSCDDAMVLECGDAPITVSSTGSTAESPDGCTIGDNGIWFSFVGTGGDITINSSAGFDHKMSMQSGSCDDLTFIECEDGSTGDETYTLEATTDGEMYYVYIAHYSSYTSSTGDITVSIECATPPTCTAPTDLAVDNITTDSAELSWTTGANQSDVYVVEAGDPAPDESSTPTESGVTSPTTLDLTVNTAYNVYVRADCGAQDGVSEWSGPISFSTPCEAGTIPFNEGFEAGYADGETLGGCWSQEDDKWLVRNQSDSYGRVSRTGDSYIALIYGSDDWIFYPLDLTGGTTYELSFYARQDATSGAQVMASFGTGDSAADMTTEILPSTEVTSDTYEEFGEEFTPASNGVYYIGIKGTTTFTPWYLTIDDISVVEAQASGYVYENGAWTPEDPNGVATATDNITVIDGEASFTQDIDVNNITVNSGATLNVESVLTISGDITNDGDMVFKSTATSNGELAEVPSGSTITGDFTVERYTNDHRAYRFVSSAVTTSNSIHANWQEGATSATDNPNPGFGTHITGTNTDQQDGFDETVTGNPSMFTLNEGSQDFDAVGNTDVNTLNAGVGYLLYVRGDRSIDLSSNDSHGSTVLRATGALHTGEMTQSFGSVASGDFVAMANPYQSSVNVNNVINNSTDINDNFAYVYDPSLGTYGSYVTVDLPSGNNDSSGSSDADNFMQPGQAVQVAVSGGSASITFNESDKAPGNHTTTFSNEDPFVDNAHINGHLYTAVKYAAGEKMHDNFSILFNQNFDNALNNKDAVKPMNFTENMGIGTADAAYSIERRELPVEGENLALFNTNYENQDYTLVLEVSEFAGTSPYLVDTYTGEETVLEAGENLYDFTVDQGIVESIEPNRFYIHFGAETLSVDNPNVDYGVHLYPNPSKAGEVFYITTGNLTAEPINVNVYDLLGKLVYTAKEQAENHKISVQTERPLSSGIYFVQISQKDQQVTKRLIIK